MKKHTHKPLALQSKLEADALIELPDLCKLVLEEKMRIENSLTKAADDTALSLRQNINDLLEANKIELRNLGLIIDIIDGVNLFPSDEHIKGVYSIYSAGQL